MSGELTQYGANLALLAGLGLGASTQTIYIALATSECASPDTATMATWNALEITSSGYERQTVTWSTAPSGDPSSLSNSAQVTFGAFTADPSAVNAAFLCNSSAGTTGNVLAFWTLTSAADAAIGGTLLFAAGSLVMTLD